MALGTAVTTGALAWTAVFAKSAAMRLAAGRTRASRWLRGGFEFAAALAVLTFGVALVIGSRGGDDVVGEGPRATARKGRSASPSPARSRYVEAEDRSRGFVVDVELVGFQRIDGDHVVMRLALWAGTGRHIRQG